MGNFKNTYSKLSTAPVKKYMSLTDGYKNLIVNKQNKFEFIPESFTISTTPIQSQVHKGGFFSESVIRFSNLQKIKVQRADLTCHMTSIRLR